MSSVTTFVWENSHSLTVSTSVVWISHMNPELGTIIINPNTLEIRLQKVGMNTIMSRDNFLILPSYEDLVEEFVFEGHIPHCNFLCAEVGLSFLKHPASFFLNCILVIPSGYLPRITGTKILQVFFTHVKEAHGLRLYLPLKKSQNHARGTRI